MNGPDPTDRAGDQVAAAVTEVRERVAAAARRVGRDPSEVTLIGASKTVPVEIVARAVDAGLTDLGENRAQELLAKAPTLAARPTPPTWHFVGQLQRNKVAALTPWVRWWHSVDRIALGQAIARRAPGARVFLEVNLAAEPRKGGCLPAEAAPRLEALRELDLEVVGLMTVAPQAGEPMRWFTALRDLATTLDLPQLSMGMSDDFEAAIEAGATMVRVGRAIFGARSP
jgi:pyridoxal phosphate enzyme (YggS family)